MNILVSNPLTNLRLTRQKRSIIHRCPEKRKGIILKTVKSPTKEKKKVINNVTE